MASDFIRNDPKLRQLIRDIKMYFVRFRYGLKHVNKTFYMGGKSKVSKDFVAGSYSFMNYGCDICPKVKMGSYVMLAPRVIITGSDHDYKQPGVPMYFTNRPVLSETVIGDDVWIGCRSIIMSGVHIGRGSVIAAGSVVTRNVEPYTIVAGVPATTVKKRFKDLQDIKFHDDMLDKKEKKWNYSKPLHG